MRILVLFVAIAAALAIGAAPARAAMEPRTVVLIADRDSPVPALATPPLNRLGFIVETHTTDAPLPPLADRSDVRGIVVWLSDGAIADESFGAWVRGAVDARLPVVMMGKLPDIEDRFGLFLALDLLYAFDDRAYTYDVRIVDWDEDIVGFERRLDPPLAPAPLMRPLDAALARSLLVLERRANPADRSHVLIATLKGAFAAEGYAVWQSADGKAQRWLVDPVAWFRTALRLDIMPVPDATTVNGRHIFAPSIAPARAEDGDATVLSAETLARAHGLRLPFAAALAANAVFLPPRDRACADRLRARLFGFDAALAPLGEDLAARDAAFAPVLLACTEERDLVTPAARAVFERARSLPLTIQRGDLRAIEAGFRSTGIEDLAGFAWRIHDRGALQTLRFDATELRVDWLASEGVLGAARASGALYVALDPRVATPTIALTRAPWSPPPFPVLVESRWIVAGLQRTGDHASMSVEGDGQGDMAWSAEPDSNWEIRLTPRTGAVLRYRIRAGADGLMSFALPAMGSDSGHLEFIRYYGSAAR